MDTTIGKSGYLGTDANSSIKPFAMLASKCKIIECSYTMHLGVHNRCSFEVKLKMKNKSFIASGPTLLSAKNKASLAALRDIYNGGNKITEITSLKALEFEKHDLSGLDKQEATNESPEEHIDGVGEYTTIINADGNLEEKEEQCIASSTLEKSNHECIMDELQSERKKCVVNVTQRFF